MYSLPFSISFHRSLSSHPGLSHIYISTHLLPWEVLLPFVTAAPLFWLCTQHQASITLAALGPWEVHPLASGGNLPILPTRRMPLASLHLCKSCWAHRAQPCPPPADPVMENSSSLEKNRWMEWRDGSFLHVTPKSQSSSRFGRYWVLCSKKNPVMSRQGMSDGRSSSKNGVHTQYDGCTAFVPNYTT